MNGPLEWDELRQLFNYAKKHAQWKRGQGSELALSRHRNRTTIARALKVCQYLVARDRPDSLTDNEITSIKDYVRYGVNARYIENLFNAYKAWRLDRGPVIIERVQGAHLDVLFAQLEKLRDCFENIDVYGSRPDDRERFEVRGVDWRLEPMMWFYLCVPDIWETERWDPEFQWLLEHMKQSEFETRLKEIRTMCKNLERSLDQAAGRVTEPGFAEKWQELKRVWWRTQEEESPIRPCRTGCAPEVSPEWTPHFSYEETSKIERMLALVDTSANFDLTRCEIEDKLRELREYVASNELNQIIAEGCCSRCRK